MTAEANGLQLPGKFEMCPPAASGFQIAALQRGAQLVMGVGFSDGV